MSEPAHVTKQRIVSGLRELGLAPGAGVMVHSSLRSFGHVEGGARTVVAALREVLTPSGTLMMPSFNHGAPFAPGGDGVFDPQKTPTTNGAVAETFWKMPGVRRSWNPTHAFAAWGKNARRYTEPHHRVLTMGAESPLGLLWQDGGVCLLLGVTYKVNTFHHVVETVLRAPCLGARTIAHPLLLPDGRRVGARTWGWREKPCPIDDETRYADEMRQRGLEKEARIGDCRAILFRLEDCFQVVAELLQHGKDGFPPCRRCPIRPRRVPQTVPSDWDDEHQRLRADSEAWSY